MMYRFISLVLLPLIFTSCSAVQWVVNGPPVEEVKPPIYQLHSLIADTSGLFFLRGTASELDTNEPVLFGAVAVYGNGKLLTGTETDFDGHYALRLDFPESTMLSIEFSYLGLETTRIDSVVAQNGNDVLLDVQMRIKDIYISCPFILDCRRPMIEIDNMSSGRTFTSDEIRRSGVRGN